LIDEMADGFELTNDQFLKSARDWFAEGSDQALCEMAKIDHVQFKKNILDVVMERTSWKSSEVPDHHSCRLGKWYDSLQTSTLTDHPSYKALVGPHKIVHEAGKQALVSFAAGDFEGAVGHIERMNTASIDVVRLLSELSASLDAEHEQENRRQFERLTTRMNARLGSSSGAENNIVIENISKSGVGISGVQLRPGEEVHISVGNDGPKRGIAKWASGDRAGIMFEEASKKPVQKKTG
jgi:methyl-accepting chemotaxis protein